MPVQNVKLVFLGDGGVGKSSMIFRVTLEHFTGSIDANFGTTFLSKNIQLDGTTFKFQIWDTARQERFRCNYSNFIHGASAIVMVYDVTNKNSFTNATTYWWKKVQKHAESNLVVALVGNKCDLEASRKVKTAEGKSFADSIGAMFLETSALTSSNLLLLLEEIARKLPATANEEEPVAPSVPSTIEKTQQKKSNCHIS